MNLSAGSYHSVFISDSIVYKCGSDYPGSRPILLPTRIDFPVEICSVSTGHNFSLFLDIEGNVWVSGNSLDGELGFIGAVETPEKFVELPPIQAIQSCPSHNYSIFLDTQGNVWGCGKNDSGQLGVQPSVNTKLHKFNNIPKITSMAAGNYHVLFVDEAGNVWGCGKNTHGQLGTLEVYSSDRNARKLEGFPLPIKSVAAGRSHSLYLDVNGNVWVSESGASGQLGISGISSCKQPMRVESLPTIVEIAASGNRSALVDENGQVWGAGSIGGQRYTVLTKLAGLENIQNISLSEFHALYLDNDGCVWVEGLNNCGQLGLGDELSRDEQEKNNNLPPILSKNSQNYRNKSARKV